MKSFILCLMLPGCSAVQGRPAALLARDSSSATHHEKEAQSLTAAVLMKEAQNLTAASVGAPQASGESDLWDSGSGLACVGWRKTLTCVPSGPRDPLQDKDCLTIVDSQESGFCECEGYVHTAAVPCGHDPINCTKECGVLQKLHREVFGAGSDDDAHGTKGDQAGSSLKMPWERERARAAAESSGDPYKQALAYGNQAVSDLNRAVTQSNTALGSARDMIGKMMNLKPWAQISQLGKDAEEAGKKTQELAKLARPFIYEQVDVSL